jgi:2-polyprenyl-3-methyl-5-hydroxy-6-metoxy-1,4-benzoquinol methylase
MEAAAPGRRMLECGCGSARMSLYMAQRGYDCTLVDYSQRALSVAKHGFDSLSLRARFVRSDMTKLSLRDEEFDIVFSGGVLQFFSDIQPPINEMTRVLKPRGMLVAQIVPRKFSIQTMADIQRTAAYALKNVLTGNLRDAFRRTTHIPTDYGVEPQSLSHYVNACELAGLTTVKGRVTSPFPALALSKGAHRLYASAMNSLIPVWRQFDESTARWTDVWGIAYTIQGEKQRCGL